MKKKVVKKKISKKSKPVKKNTKKKGFFSRLFGTSKTKPVKKKKQKGQKKKPEESNLKQVMNQELKLDRKAQKQIPKEKINAKKQPSSNRKIKADIPKKQPKIKESKKNCKKEIIKATTKKQPPKQFLKTGLKGFDELFDKDMGIPSGAAVLVEGGPGSGKTIFCLATMNELCKQGKKCLYMSFEESEEQLISHMEAFNWNARDCVKKGTLRISRFDAIDVSRSIEALLSAAKKELLIEVEPMFFPDDFKPDFVVIDSLTSIASAFSGEESRFRIYMEQLFRYLEKNKITNFLIREVSSPSHIGTTFKEQGEAVSFLSDGIIVIYNVIYDSGDRGSAIEVLKMRGSSFKKNLVELKITNKKGLTVFPNKIIKKTGKKKFNLT